MSGPKIEEAPKDILRYAGRFLDLKDIMMCRIVCKRWKEIIDDSKHDNYLFQHFTLERENLNGNRMFYQAAKNAYIVEKNLTRPVQMDEYAPIIKRKKKCSGNCCGNNCCNNNCRNYCCSGDCCCSNSCRGDYDAFAWCAILIACVTCCCCCCCCGTQKTVPFM